MTGPCRRLPARRSRGDSDRTDAALEGLIFASRETVVVLRSHVQLVEQAVGRYEADPDPQPAAAGGEPAGGGAAVESEPAGDFAGWVRQVNADVAAVEQAADEAEQAAAGTGGWFTRSSGCLNAEGRMAQAINRVQALTFMGTRRPQFIPAEAGSQAWRELEGRIDEARQRARAACESIGPPPPAR